MKTRSEAWNVIPERVEGSRGTVRTFDAGIRKLAENRFRALVEGTVAGFGGSVRSTGAWDTPQWSTPIRKPTSPQRSPKGSAARGRWTRTAPRSWAVRISPTCCKLSRGPYIQVGNGDTAEVHHPAYNFNDEAIALAASTGPNSSKPACPRPERKAHGLVRISRLGKPRFVDELVDFVRIPSVSAAPTHIPDVVAAGDWVVRRLQAAGMENVRMMPTEGHPVVYAD